MDNKKSYPALVRLAIVTALTTLVWVGFDIYRSATTKPPPTVPEDIIAPLDPNLDLKTLEKLLERIYIEDSQINDLPIQNPLNITEEVSEVETTNESTESATIEGG